MFEFAWPGGRACRRIRRLGAWLLATGAVCAPAWPDFPMAGANPQRTGFVDTAGPMTGPARYWEKHLGLPGEANTQPVLDAAGNLYVTAAPARRSTWNESGLKPAGALISLRPDGSERWRYTWTWDPDAPENGGTWSQLSGPVVTRHGLVVMGHRHGLLRAWNKDTGALQWERDLSPGGSPITANPVADAQGYVYVHCRDIPTVRKIDRHGKDIWVHRFVDGESGHTSSPSLSSDEKTLYIGRSTDLASYLYAIDTDTGAFKWAWSPETSDNHAFSWPIPVAGSKGMVYMQDEKRSHLYAVRDTGRLHAMAWTFKRGGHGAPRLMALDQRGPYTAHIRDTSPVVFAVDTEGTERWAHTFDEGTRVAGMVAGSTALFVGVNGAGTIHALDKRDGTPIWTYKTGDDGTNFSEGLTLSPAGVLYAAVNAPGSGPAILALGEGDSRALGYVNQWLLCGPFANGNGKGHDAVYEPEMELDFTAIYFGKNDLPALWRPTSLPEEMSFVSLAEVYPNTPDASAYALCWIENKGEARPVDFRIGTGNPFKVLLNDDVIWERSEARAMRPDTDVVPVNLPAGASTVMLKLSHGRENWGFYFRITERGNTRLPDGIRASYTPGHGQTTWQSTPQPPPAALEE